MSLRMLGCLLLLVLLAAFTFPMIAPTQQPPDDKPQWLKWEYRVIKLDASSCSSENEVTTALNTAGQQGWELISYEQAAPQFPRNADGALLIAPAATGPSRGTNPPTADSFQGTISMKMPQPPSGGCRMILKRLWYPPAKH